MNNKVGWAVGESGTIFKTSNSGATWQLQSSQSYLLYDLYFVTDKIGYAVGDRGEILYTKMAARIGNLRTAERTSALRNILH